MASSPHCVDGICYVVIFSVDSGTYFSPPARTRSKYFRACGPHEGIELTKGVSHAVRQLADLKDAVLSDNDEGFLGSCVVYQERRC